MSAPLPVVICPYVHDRDRETVREAFRLDERGSDRIPFYFWHDRDRIGPEFAYERCWQNFPDRDVIIIHTDMAPLPDDTTHAWYDGLVHYASQNPEAGMIACDLLYPRKSSRGLWFVQCAGGTFEAGKVDYIGGGVDIRQGIVGERASEYTPEYSCVREVEWVTFGGVLIRRRVIEACGPIDRRYRWAYFMDVDYCLEATIRGFRLFHVPVQLLHVEQGTTHAFLREKRYQEHYEWNKGMFEQKWKSWLETRAVAAHNLTAAPFLRTEAAG